MALARSSNTSPGPHVPWSSLARQAVVGFLFGYIVLHPVSMVIFRWLDPRVAAAMPDGMAGSLLSPIAHSFHLSMLPMGLVFGMIGAAITTFYGCFRLAITRQRDRLAEQLRRNEQLRLELARQAERLKRSNEELARLELANRRTAQFMAHDFKTSLSCVGGFASQLLEKPELRRDRDAASALRRIRRQAHRMMGGVTDLLEFARVREKAAPRRERISASELLREVVSDFSLPAHEGHIAIGKHHIRCPTLSGDPRLLRRVLCNLISNAIQHNGPRTRVWLDARAEESSEKAVFSCRDDGLGVPPVMLPLIFREFAATGDSSGASTGLGLAFCKAVVESHGGRIWCENSPQQGVQFFFTIPLDKERENDRRVCGPEADSSR